MQAAVFKLRLIDFFFFFPILLAFLVACFLRSDRFPLCLTCSAQALRLLQQQQQQPVELGLGVGLGYWLIDKTIERKKERKKRELKAWARLGTTTKGDFLSPASLEHEMKRTKKKKKPPKRRRLQCCLLLLLLLLFDTLFSLLLKSLSTN